MEKVLGCCRAQSFGKCAVDFAGFGVVLKCYSAMFWLPLHLLRIMRGIFHVWPMFFLRHMREYSSSFTVGWSHLGKGKKTKNLNKTESCRLLLIFPLTDQSWKLNDIYLCSWMSEGQILHQPKGRSKNQTDVAMGFLALGLICKTDHFSLLYLTLNSWKNWHYKNFLNCYCWYQKSWICAFWMHIKVTSRRVCIKTACVGGCTSHKIVWEEDRNAKV